jgi:hypothetical protein
MTIAQLEARVSPEISDTLKTAFEKGMHIHVFDDQDTKYRRQQY